MDPATDHPDVIKNTLQTAFVGSPSRYYSHKAAFISINYTDGVRYLVDQCGAYWMLDVIASYQVNRNVRLLDKQVYSFKKTDTGGIFLTIKDPDGSSFAKQDIEFTDFPLDEITICLTDGVAHLPSEQL